MEVERERGGREKGGTGKCKHPDRLPLFKHHENRNANRATTVLPQYWRWGRLGRFGMLSAEAGLECLAVHAGRARRLRGNCAERNYVQSGR